MEKKEASSSESPSHYIGIGASAGGLQAIEEFFKEMPIQSGAAFIVVQHLSPHFKSLMVELLSKKTPLTVRRAEDGMRPEKDCVYLIPPKKNLIIYKGKLVLSDQNPQGGINFPIDLFLESLATDQGNKGIAIILSGTGSDGTLGIRAVKDHGGIVFAQDDLSAKFDGMPRSAISTGLVDFILPPSEMPRQVVAVMHHKRDLILRGESSETKPHLKGLDRLFALLMQRYKIDFSLYKQTTALRRIERRMAINQIENVDDYVRYVEVDMTESATLHQELLIGVTSFFRDEEAFEFLLNEVVPDLMEDQMQEDFRAWVCGCSTGEEAYTVAITCAETAAAVDFKGDIKIFATDINKESVNAAALGHFPESISSTMPEAYLEKYFDKSGSSYQVKRSVREMVIFAPHNLLKDPPFTKVSLVTCRNMLIYFRPAAQQMAISHLHFALKPSGVLFLGPSETTGDLSDQFETLSAKWNFYRVKNSGRAARANILSRVSTVAGVNNPLFTPRLSATQPIIDERMLSRLLDMLGEDYLPLAIVVNAQQEVLHLVGEAAPYLRMPQGRMINNVIKLAHSDISVPLTTGLHKAIRERIPVHYNKVRVKRGDKRLRVRISIRPFPMRRHYEDYFVVLIEEESLPQSAPGVPEAQFDLDEETTNRLRDLELELQYTKESLQATIEELETSNEELQATNEELLASNEELQSTNEELQSVNEELFSVNAEYQAKIMELTELNNDIDNLMSGTELCSVFLDVNLEVRKFTPDISRIIDLRESDIGRSISLIGHHLRNVNLLEIFKSVHFKGTPHRDEVQAHDGTWYLMRVVPYRIDTQENAGIVAVFIDIHWIKESPTPSLPETDFVRLVEKTAHIGAWELDLRTFDISCVEEVDRIYGFRSAGPKSLEDFIEMHLEEDQRTLRDGIRDAVDANKALDQTVRFRGAQGDVRWVRVFADKTVDAENRPVKLFGIIQEISWYKDIELSLYYTQRFLRALVEWGQDLDRETTLDQLKQSACQFLIDNLGVRSVGFARLIGEGASLIIGASQSVDGETPLPQILSLDTHPQRALFRQALGLSVTSPADIIELNSPSTTEWKPFRIASKAGEPIRELLLVRLAEGFRMDKQLSLRLEAFANQITMLLRNFDLNGNDR